MISFKKIKLYSIILEDNGEVKIYYGASDTVECLATAKLNDLIALCCEDL